MQVVKFLKNRSLHGKQYNPVRFLQFLRNNGIKKCYDANVYEFISIVFINVFSFFNSLAFNFSIVTLTVRSYYVCSLLRKAYLLKV